MDPLIPPGLDSGRLLIVSHYYRPHVGGIEMVVEGQARSAARRGMPVTILTSRAGRHTGPVADDPGVEVLRVPAWNGIEKRAGIPYPVFGARFALAAWRQAGRADVVHIHDVFYLSSILATLVVWLRRKPFHLTQHVAVVEHPSRLVRWAQRAVYRSVGRWMFRRARSVLVYNANVAATVRAYGGSAARVVELRNGVDPEIFRPASSAERSALRLDLGLPADRPVVLFVGRFVASKGVEIVLGAASPAWTTVLAGGNDRGLAAPGVVVAGIVAREKLADWYRAADLFILPCATEIFPLAVQEAMACGLPVITTDDPGYRHYEFDRDLVRLVERRPQALRGAIEAVLADRVLRRRMSVYSRRLAMERFSWESNVSAAFELYRSGGGEAA